ncbi:hypothetical protein SUGI_1100210 [Cryptomeria japonica]|nr:hypothetical protein SUGI_1100210 [Cryptomeria japonica]
MEWVFWGLAAVCAGLILFLVKIVTRMWWKPLQVKKFFEAQGISGPPYRLFYGNTTDISRMIDEQKSKPMPLSHDMLPRVFPHLHQWSRIYGYDYVFWFGPNARLGLVGLTGEKWARHRKIINPAFHMDLLKGMIPTIIESSANMLEEWSKLVLSGASEIEVLKEFRELTADIIARTAFGSSFIEGKDIFDMQAKQMVLTSELFHTVYIPGFRFLPTAKNR